MGSIDALAAGTGRDRRQAAGESGPSRASRVAPAVERWALGGRVCPASAKMDSDRADPSESLERPERREAPRRKILTGWRGHILPISPPRSRRTGSADCAQASRLGPASRRGQSYGRDRRRPDYHSEENDGEPWPKPDHSALNPTTMSPKPVQAASTGPHQAAPRREYCANNPAIPLRVRTKPDVRRAQPCRPRKSVTNAPRPGRAAEPARSKDGRLDRELVDRSDSNHPTWPKGRRWPLTAD